MFAKELSKSAVSIPRMRGLLTSIAILSLVGGCSSANISSQSSSMEQVTTTVVLTDEELVSWLKEVNEKSSLPNVTGLSREQSVMKISEMRYGVRDLVVVSQRSADARISNFGASWVAEIEESLSQIVEAMAARNSTAVANALGRYSYLRSKEKVLQIIDCMSGTASC